MTLEANDLGGNDLDDGLSLFSDMMAAERVSAEATAAPAEQPAPQTSVTDAPNLDRPAVDPSPAPATPAPTETTAARSTLLRDALRGRGFQYDDAIDDDGVLTELMEAATLAQEHGQYAHLIEQGRRYQQHGPMFEQWMAQQMGGQAPAQPTAPAAPALPTTVPAEQDLLAAWKSPEHDARWEQMCEYDRQLGTFRYRDDVLKYAQQKNIFLDPQVPQKLHAYKQWEGEVSQRMIREFPTLVEQVAERKARALQEEFLKASDERYENRRVNDQIEEFVNANRKHLFLTDDQGRTQVDPRNNQPLRSPFGKLVNYHTKALLADYYGGKQFEDLPAGEKRKVVTRAFRDAQFDWSNHQAQFAAQQPTLSAPEPQAIAQAAADTDPAAEPEATAAAPAERPRDARGRFVENAIEHAKTQPKTAGGADAAERRDQTLDDEDDDASFSQLMNRTASRMRNGHAART